MIHQKSGRGRPGGEGGRRPTAHCSPFYNGAVEQYTWTALGNFDFTAETKKLALPVLVLYGKDDPFGMRMVETVVSSLSSADVEFVLLEKCGHYWHECPDQFFPSVRDYLKDTR